VLLNEYQAATLARALADTTSGGPFDAATVDLFQANITIAGNETLAELVAGVATYTGYAQGVITWDAPSVASDGTVEVVGTLAVFRPTGTAIKNVIYGAYIANAAASALLFAGNLTNPPVAMGSALDQISLTIRYRPATQSIAVEID
jgi:hypothetical protein